MNEITNKIKARELYQSGFGSLAKISKSLGENVNTIKAWKKRDKDSGEDWVKMGAKKDAPKIIKDAPNEEKVKKVAKIKKEKIKKIEDRLTEKQKLFAYFYIQSFNGTQSAIKAGYSVKGAHVEASNLLKNIKVKRLIEELRDDFNHDIGLTTQMILSRHAKIAFSNTLDFIKEDGTMKPFESVDGSLLDTVKITNKDTEFGKDKTVSVKVEGRAKSLDFLTKHIGLDKLVAIAEEKLKIEKVKVKIDIEKHTGAGKGKNKLAEAVKKKHEERVKAKEAKE